MITLIITLAIGLLLVGIGLLIPRFPNLIAGYNTASDEEKKKIDIQELTRFMRSSLVKLGVGFVVLQSVGMYLRPLPWFDFVFMFFFIGMILVIILGALRYDRRRSRLKYIGLGLSIGIIVIIAILIGYMATPATIEVRQQHLHISGIYGDNIPLEQIQSVEITGSLPRIQLRTNGIGLPNTKVGYFKLEDWGRCKLFIHGQQPPYLVLRTTDGRTLIINRQQEGEVQRLSQQIQQGK